MQVVTWSEENQAKVAGYIHSISTNNTADDTKHAENWDTKPFYRFNRAFALIIDTISKSIKQEIAMPPNLSHFHASGY